MYVLIFSRIEIEKHIKAIEPFAERSHISRYGTGYREFDPKPLSIHAKG